MSFKISVFFIVIAQTLPNVFTQLTFTCSKLTIKTLEQRQ